MDIYNMMKKLFSIANKTSLRYNVVMKRERGIGNGSIKNPTHY